MKAILQAVHPVLMVRDVGASIRFYSGLGFELHLQWHAAAEWNYPNDRPTYRIVVDDVDKLADEFMRVTDLDRTDVRDTPWGASDDNHLPHRTRGGGLASCIYTV